MIIEIYKATLIETLKIETFFSSLNLYVKRLAVRAKIKIYTTKATNKIKKICERIYR